MLSREEFKRTVAMIFNDIRRENDEQPNCSGVDCNDCPFRGLVCFIVPNDVDKLFKAVELVEGFAKRRAQE